MPLPPNPPGALTGELIDEIDRLWTVVRALSNTAHDVNNALQVIAGNAELLETSPLDPVVERRVAAIHSQASKAAAAIGQLLWYSREGASGVEVVDLAVLLSAAVSMRACSLRRARIEAVIERSDAGVFCVAADRRRLTQLLLTLIGMMEEAVRGYDRARIVATIARSGRSVVVSIRGAGDGPLTAPVSSAAVDGDVLGRAAERLAASHHGTLLREGEGEGSVLRLTLPEVATA